MRKAETIESLYLDFDGFFASVMQQAFPKLRGRPVGVVPFENAGNSTVVIACSKEAKAAGCTNVMPVPAAREQCPDIVLVPQRVDLFRRAHNTLLNEIRCEIPIETIKSIDELACRLDRGTINDPHALAARISKRIAENVGPYITCSMGLAANRMLAKIACKIDKPNGVTIWRPENMPDPLEKVTFDDIPGIGGRMARRLNKAGIWSVSDLLRTQPKQMRALWRNVNGERMWYALHGYDIKAQPTGRSMFGHGRVLPPDLRDIRNAQTFSRFLMQKAAFRMRRDKFYANKLWLWLDIRNGGWFGQETLHHVHDDQACLAALGKLWDRVKQECRRNINIVRVGITLLDLSPAESRQLDLFNNDDAIRMKWERITSATDFLNRKFGKRVISIGPWTPPPGGYAGAKISYTRIPSSEDFW
ncbi:MAG: type VI secretion protein ImpB [Alphaproteobacteria bacterium]|nr:type VI secretion protein ImpB [Alphaproteobacteria bacterium]